MTIGIRNILVIIVMSLIIMKFSRFERTRCNSELRVWTRINIECECFPLISLPSNIFIDLSFIWNIPKKFYQLTQFNFPFLCHCHLQQHKHASIKIFNMGNFFTISFETTFFKHLKIKWTYMHCYNWVLYFCIIYKHVGMASGA